MAFLPRDCYRWYIHIRPSFPKPIIDPKISTFDAIKISGNQILNGSLTGSEPDVPNLEHIGYRVEVQGIQPNFRFYNSVYQFWV